MSVKVIDQGADKAIALSRKGRLKLHIGILSPEAGQPHTRTGYTLGEIALFNEFGTSPTAKHPGVPARSFLRDWASEHVDEVSRDFAADYLRAFFADADEKAALSKRGKQYAQQVKSRMKAGIPPDNAASTRERKGHGNTLQDTGALIKAIRFEVVK